jgi:phospho-N-acetylmuramoyl-pentapeptide-transferase
VYRVLAALLISLTICITMMPLFIRWLKHRGIGQFIREDGPQAHFVKEGTPTMGGVLIVVSTIIGFALMAASLERGIGFAFAFIMLTCGILGFVDDFRKVKRQRSLGLRPTRKLLWQLVISIALAYLLINHFGVDTKLYFFKASDALIDLKWAYYPLVFLMVVGFTNAVNLTDGLDGLASGATSLAMTAYILIAFTQFRNNVFLYSHVPSPLDSAIFAGALMGGCIGFLWWNTPPARIFMGDTGSLALGGALAALAITTKTEFLALVIGGLFVMETLSVSLQVFFFKTTGRRVFRMAPLHHHFEMKGWSEETVLVRFWIAAGLLVGLGFILFYINYVGTF